MNFFPKILENLLVFVNPKFLDNIYKQSIHSK